MMMILKQICCKRMPFNMYKTLKNQFINLHSCVLLKARKKAYTNKIEIVKRTACQ